MNIVKIMLCVFYYSFASCSSNISFLKKCQSPQKIDFWHLAFFQQTKLPLLTGKNTNIVILDLETGLDYSNSNKGSDLHPNFNSGEFYEHSLSNRSKNKKPPAQTMKKIGSSGRFVQKNHGNCTLGIIKQLAPEVTIISIPVLDDRGYGNKGGVYQALKLAKTYNPDILHLGFQILDFDPRQKLDKKIYKLLKKFTLVIVPIGNNLKSNFPPKSPQIFSVASFGKKGKSYPISDFCQNIIFADFIMPGEEIWVTVWNFDLQDKVTLSVSGTSFSAAIMTGLTALLFEKYSKKISQIRGNLLKSCTFLDEDWQSKIRWGCPKF